MQGFLAILMAIPYTLLITAGAFVLGFAAAIPLMFAGRSRIAFIRFLARIIIDLARGIPPIVWLLFIFFGLPTIRVMLNPIQAAIIGLGIVSSAYLAEIFRGGLLAVHRGQFEASRALGLSTATTFAEIIAPQALRAVIPGLATYFIGLIKDSSIASVIGAAEMVYTAGAYARISPQGIYLFFWAALVYIVLSVPLGLASRTMEARLHRAGAR